MSDVTCEKWHELIAMDVFGDLSLEESTGLFAHLEGCVECRTISKEMSETFSLLQYVDPFTIESTALVPSRLSERVLRDLHLAGVAQRRQRILRRSAVAVVGAMAAASIMVLVFAGGSANVPPERTLALSGSSSVKASATLVKRAWGTSLDLHEQGLPGGQVYTVSMKTAKGTWWTAGTYTSVAGEPVSATMACAVAFGRITGVRVVNGSGETVLTSYHDTSTSTY